jgi:hypothetical protein
MKTANEYMHDLTEVINHEKRDEHFPVSVERLGKQIRICIWDEAKKHVSKMYDIENEFQPSNYCENPENKRCMDAITNDVHDKLKGF